MKKQMSILSRDEKTGKILSVYTPEQDEFIKENYPIYGRHKTTELFNKKFGTNKTMPSIYQRAKYNGIHWNGRCEWDEDQIEYLKEIYPNRSVEESTRMLNEKFGTTHAETAVQTKANRIGVKTGYRSQNFKKGKTNEYIDSAPIGTIRTWSKYKGKKYPMIKIKDTVGEDRRENWILYKNYVWEQNNGKIPEGYFVSAIDGDEENCDISNLRCIPTKYVALMAIHNKWFEKGEEIFDAGTAYCDLYYALREKEKDDE